MKSFAVFVTLFVAAVLAVKHEPGSCYKETEESCSQLNNKPSPSPQSITCNSVYGNIGSLSEHLVRFANEHIIKSFEYLLMSTHYGNYQKNRPGFEKLFRDLSDKKWEQSIELIKYITRRGASMNFGHLTTFRNPAKNSSVYELYEIQSLSKALDMEKELALEAFEVHEKSSQRNENRHDPEISSYIEKEFMHQHAKDIRELAGYVTDLKSTLSGPDAALSLYLFDEYLQKQ